MGSFLSYSITAGLYLLGLHLAYRLFLARENQHGFNRGVLLGIYFTSFVAIPMLLGFRFQAQNVALQGPLVEGIAEGNTQVVTHGSIWATVLIWVYMAGMVVVGVRTLITWYRLTEIIRKGQKIFRDGYALILTENDKYAPFSWMRYVVISRKDFDDGSSAITTHELKHIAAFHWLDLIVAQVVCIVNWFNPAAWLMRDDMMLVHEYQADMAVIDSGHNPQEYQMLLIKKAVGSRFPSLANSLNHSKLKKRITMMYKEKSGAGRKLKALALVPALALVLGVASVPAVRAAVSTIDSSEISPDKGNENLSNGETQDKKFSVIGINDSGEETSIVINGVNLGSNLSVSGGSLTIGSQTLSAKSLTSNMTDGKAIITVVFPYTGSQEGADLKLNINGRDVSFNLKDFYKNAKSVMVEKQSGDKNTSVILVNGASSPLPNDLKIIYNGEEITQARLSEISVENITSVTVDKQNNKIIITSK